MNYSQLANPRILEQPVYQPGKPIEVVAREQGFEPNEVQTEQTLESLKDLMSLIPLIGVFISFVLVYFYPIDREFHKKLIDEINLRKLKNV